MSDETNDPGAPEGEGASDEQPARSVWSSAPTASEAGGAETEPSPPQDAEGTEAGGADADVVAGADADEPEPADETPAETAAPPAVVPEGTEAGVADADVVTGADVDVGRTEEGTAADGGRTDEGTAADSGVEAADVDSDSTATAADAGTADATERVEPTEPAADEVTRADSAGTDDDTERDEPTETGTDESTGADEGKLAEERRAALEQEIDRQLTALEIDLDEGEGGGATATAEDEADEDDDAADAPVTASDEADALLDQLDVDDGSPAETVAPSAVVAEPTVDQPVRAADEGTDELTRIAAGAELAERSSRGPVVPIVVIAVLIAAVVGIVIAVGSGGDETDEAGGSTTTTPTTVAPAASPDLLPATAAEALEYFEVYGTQDPAQLPRMLQLSAPHTPAGYYAIHQETLARIDPQRNAPLTVSLEGDAIEACPADPATGACVTYGDFRKNEAGLLTSFTVNGTPLRERMAIGAGNEVVANSMRISIISRYVSVSDRLFLAFTVHNDGATPIAPVSVRYITPAGETLEPDNDTFRAPVPPGTSAVAAAAFPTTAAGGTLAVTSTSDGGNSQQLAQISTP